MARDPRSVTLDRESAARVARQVRVYQSWAFRELERHGVRWDSVADIGCGNGDWTVELAARSWRLLAVDFTAEFVDTCRRRVETVHACEARFAVSDLSSFEFDEACDLVTAGAVTQYLDDREVHALLARIRVALAERSGLLYLRTTIAKRAVRRSIHTGEYQAIYRSKVWYLDALRAAGFEVLSSATATEFVADEWSRRWLGRGGWLLAWALRLVRRAYRGFRRTEVLACVARPAVRVAAASAAPRGPDAVVLALGAHVADAAMFV